MKHELSLKDDINKDDLDTCLRIYSDNHKQIHNILNYHKIDKKIETKDEYECAKILNINNAFKKVINALNCEFIPKNIDPGKIIGYEVDKNLNHISDKVTNIESDRKKIKEVDNKIMEKTTGKIIKKSK